MIAWGKAHDLPRFSVLADDKLFIAAKNAGIGHHLATLSKEQIVTFEKVWKSSPHSDEVLHLARLGFLFRNTHAAVSACVSQIVCLDTPPPNFYYSNFSDDCPGPDGYCDVLVDRHYLGCGVHLLPAQIPLEPRCAGALWQPTSLPHHRSDPLDTDRLRYSLHAYAHGMEAANANTPKDCSVRSVPPWWPVGF